MWGRRGQFSWGRYIISENKYDQIMTDSLDHHENKKRMN